MGQITAAITAVQGYVPEHILSNDDLAKLVDTSDEWITSRTGIKERRIMKDGASSDMAAAAVQKLLDKKGIDPAIATGPFITTSNDIFGIFLFFYIAKIILGF